MKIFWVSRHPMTSEQRAILNKIHKDAEIEHWNLKFVRASGLYDFIKEHPEGLTYSVAAGVHYLYAFSHNAVFNLFETRPSFDDEIGIKAVWHCENGKIEMIWQDSGYFEYVRE